MLRMIQLPSYRSLFITSVFLLVAPVQGCGLILGLDEYGPAADNVAGAGGSGGATTGTGGGGAGQGGGDPGSGGQGGGGPIPSWSRLFGPANDQTGASVVVDKSGNVILTGYFDETIEFDSTKHVSAGQTDFFLAKLHPTGDVLWSKRLGNAGANIDPKIAADSDGNITMCGTFSGSIDFGGGSIPSVGGADLFVAKFDKDGSHVWSKGFGSASNEYIKRIEVDASGDILVAGEFSGSFTFGGSMLTSSGLTDIFLAKLAAGDGSHLWSQRFGDIPGKPANEQLLDDMSLDSSDSLIVTGRFSESMQLGNFSLTSKGGRDNFVAKIDSEGAVSWGKSFGNNTEQNAASIAVDTSGSAILSGHFAGAIDFGGGEVSSDGAFGAFVVKLSAIGNHTWSRTFAKAASIHVSSSKADGDDRVSIAGSYTGPLELDTETITGTGLYLITLDKDGQSVDYRVLGDTESQSIRSLAIDPLTNQLVITGQTITAIDFGQGPLTSSGDFDAFIAKLSP